MVSDSALGLQFALSHLSCQHGSEILLPACFPYSRSLLSTTHSQLSNPPGKSRSVLERNASSYEEQADELFAERHGCLPAPRIENQRPWGVDRLEQIFRGDRESRLMELFLFHFRQTGNTVEQVFIGSTAFDTIEPANLEAILSTKFQGI